MKIIKSLISFILWALILRIHSQSFTSRLSTLSIEHQKNEQGKTMNFSVSHDILWTFKECLTKANRPHSSEHEKMFFCLSWTSPEVDFLSVNKVSFCERSGFEFFCIRKRPEGEFQFIFHCFILLNFTTSESEQPNSLFNWKTISDSAEGCLKFLLWKKKKEKLQNFVAFFFWSPFYLRIANYLL